MSDNFEMKRKIKYSFELWIISHRVNFIFFISLFLSSLYYAHYSIKTIRNSHKTSGTKFILLGVNCLGHTIINEIYFNNINIFIYQKRREKTHTYTLIKLWLYMLLLIEFNNIHNSKIGQSQLFLWRMKWLWLLNLRSMNVIKLN